MKKIIITLLLATIASCSGNNTAEFNNLPNQADGTTRIFFQRNDGDVAKIYESQELVEEDEAGMKFLFGQRNIVPYRFHLIDATDPNNLKPIMELDKGEDSIMSRDGNLPYYIDVEAGQYRLALVATHKTEFNNIQDSVGVMDVNIAEGMKFQLLLGSSPDVVNQGQYTWEIVDISVDEPTYESCKAMRDSALTNDGYIDLLYAKYGDTPSKGLACNMVAKANKVAEPDAEFDQWLKEKQNFINTKISERLE